MEEGNKQKHHTIWKDIDEHLWNDWKWQLRNRITTLQGLKDVIILTKEEEEGIKNPNRRLPMAITPYFASLMDRDDPNCPIRRQVVPRIEESKRTSSDQIDPLSEEAHSPVPGLVHRYPDRVLLLSTDKCASYCRYCTRERLVGERETCITEDRLQAICNYLKEHKEVRDVVISGGDPLLMQEKKLEFIIKSIREIEHIEIIRLGTKVPVTLPQRITHKLTSMLKKYQPLYMSIHFTHPKEITPEVKRACDLLSDAGLPLGSQTVLLKGINDDAPILKKLFQELLKVRVRPYYLYQCDLVRGTGHFRTKIEKGIEIINQIRGFTSGYAVPTYVIDAPGGGGKIPVSPLYIVSHDDNRVILRNYENKVFEYVEPKDNVLVEEKGKGKPELYL